MKALSASERRLALFLGAALFLAAIAFSAKWYRMESARLQADIFRLEANRADYAQLLEEKDHWLTRGAWMAEHPAEPYAGSPSDSRFAEEMQRTITEGGLAIEAQEIHDAEHQGALVKSIIEVTVRGSLEQIVRWLNTIQQPGRYVAVQALNLKRVDNNATMAAHVRIAKIQSEPTP